MFSIPHQFSYIPLTIAVLFPSFTNSFVRDGLGINTVPERKIKSGKQRPRQLKFLSLKNLHAVDKGDKISSYSGSIVVSQRIGEQKSRLFP